MLDGSDYYCDYYCCDCGLVVGFEVDEEEGRLNFVFERLILFVLLSVCSYSDLGRISAIGKNSAFFIRGFQINFC